MDNIIELTRENYADYLPIQVKAFYFASSGAMGCPGEFILVENHVRIFQFNISTFDGNRSEIERIIPLFYECGFGMFGAYELPEGWNGIYLGAGNHLIIHDSIREEFIEKAKDYKYLYSKWLKILIEILDDK